MQLCLMNGAEMQSDKNISIKQLKVFVSEHFPPGYALREAILRLNDRIDKPSFLLWVPIWFELARVKPDK